jgi:hypothetical protein
MIKFVTIYLAPPSSSPQQTVLDPLTVLMEHEGELLNPSVWNQRQEH